MAHTTALGVALTDPLADEAQVEFGLQMVVEVISGNEVLAGDRYQFVEATGHGRPSIGSLQSEVSLPNPRGAADSGRLRRWRGGHPDRLVHVDQVLAVVALGR